jgi:hypothetical protein
MGERDHRFRCIGHAGDDAHVAVQARPPLIIRVAAVLGLLTGLFCRPGSEGRMVVSLRVVGRRLA